MVADLKLFANDLGDPLQGPQLGAVSSGLGTAQEDLGQVCFLLGGEIRRPPGNGPRPQAGEPAPLIGVDPSPHGPLPDPQGPGNRRDCFATSPQVKGAPPPLL